MSVNSNIELSIITPCYNPIKGWEQNYVSSYKSIKNMLHDIEIEWILVNDGSENNVSATNIDFLKQNIIHFKYLNYSQNKGKGFAVRYGAKHASADKTIFTDIDFPYLDTDLKAVYELINQGNDIIIGKRSENYYDNISTNRKWISKQFKKLIKLLLNIPVTDTQAGIKGFNKKGKDILLKTTINRYLFDLELVKIASKQKANIVETAVSLKPGIVMPNMSTKILFSEFINLLKIMLK